MKNWKGWLIATGIMAMMALAPGCTMNMTSDIERFGRIEKALAQKADAGAVQGAFDKMGQAIQANARAAADARAAAEKKGE